MCTFYLLFVYLNYRVGVFCEEQVGFWHFFVYTSIPVEHFLPDYYICREKRDKSIVINQIVINAKTDESYNVAIIDLNFIQPKLILISFFNVTQMIRENMKHFLNLKYWLIMFHTNVPSTYILKYKGSDGISTDGKQKLNSFNQNGFINPKEPIAWLFVQYIWCLYVPIQIEWYCTKEKVSLNNFPRLRTIFAGAYTAYTLCSKRLRKLLHQI